MVLNMQEHIGKLKGMNISISYSGPLWYDGIKGIAEVVKSSLTNNELPSKTSNAIFSVFVEQTANMIMHSGGKNAFSPHDTEEVSTGMLVMGDRDKNYFIQTGNVINRQNIAFLKDRIDHLNTLDKTELRQYQMEKMRSENDNPQSKGAGLGLIEIARRATAPIEYTFEPVDENVSFFTMYVEIAQDADE